MINELFLYVSGIIELLAGYYYFNRLLGKKIPSYCYVLASLTGIGVLSLNDMENLLKFIIYVLLFVISGVLIQKVKVRAVLLYAVLILEIMHVSYGIINSLSGMAAPIVFPVNPEVAGVLFMWVGSAIAVMLSVLFYVLVEKYFKSVGIGNETYLLLMLVPSLLIFLVSEYISRKTYGNTLTISAEGEVSLGINPCQALFVQVFAMSSLFCVLYACKKMSESLTLKRKMALLEQETHYLNEYVEEARIRLENTRAFRHDAKNHIMIVKELLQNDSRKAALQYIGGMDGLVEGMSFSVNTNNPVLDILLGNKLGIAEKRKIQVKCSLAVPYPCEIQDIDFGIVLANALDNAINACMQVENEKRRFVHITGRLQGAFIAINISNSYIGERIIKEETGLANIRAVAEKYQGAVEVKTESGIFTLGILLVIPHHSDDSSLQVG